MGCSRTSICLFWIGLWMIALWVLCVVSVVFSEWFCLHFKCVVLLGVMWFRVDRLGMIWITMGLWIFFPFFVPSFPIIWEDKVSLVKIFVPRIQHVWFYLNHFSGRVYIGKTYNNTWLQFQASGISHIISSPWMDWFHGGL